jgi:hypothetical protein
MMKTQKYHMTQWTLLSLWLYQFVLFLAARRRALCLALLSLNTFHLSTLSALYAPGNTLHLFNKVPFAEPWP